MSNCRKLLLAKRLVSANLRKNRKKKCLFQANNNSFIRENRVFFRYVWEAFEPHSGNAGSCDDCQNSSAS